MSVAPLPNTQAAFKVSKANLGDIEKTYHAKPPVSELVYFSCGLSISEGGLVSIAGALLLTALSQPLIAWGSVCLCFHLLWLSTQ